MNNQLEIEIITHVLGSMNHCSHCQVFIDGVGVGDQIHKTDLESYPPDWMREWQQLSDLVHNLTERYAGKLVIRITDAQTPSALWKALRYRIRKYPTFLIAGERYHGYDEHKLTDLIDRHLPEAA